MVGRLREEWDTAPILDVVPVSKMVPSVISSSLSSALFIVPRPVPSALWAKPRAPSGKHSPAFGHVHPDVHAVMATLETSASPISTWQGAPFSFTPKSCKLCGVSITPTLSLHFTYPTIQFICRKAGPLLKDPPQYQIHLLHSFTQYPSLPPPPGLPWHGGYPSKQG